MRRVFKLSAWLIVALVTLIATARGAWPGSPPEDLLKLEKLVSLELAHVRDAGPTDSVRREQLFEAHQLDRQGEDAIKAGNYQSAEESLLKARVILRRLAE